MSDPGQAKNASMYFVAILCPPELDQKVVAYKEWMRSQFGCTIALKSPAHITLVKPFWLELNWEDYLVQAMKAFKNDTGELTISTNDFSSFGKRVIFIDIVDDLRLDKTRQDAEAHLRHAFGDTVKKGIVPYRPHITIANRDLKPGDFDKAWKHFEKIPIKESFSTNTVSLLKLNEGKWTVLAESNWNEEA